MKLSLEYLLLQLVNAKLDRLLNLETKMSKELDDLTAEVARNTSLEQSAIALIQGLVAQIAAAGTDPVALAALTANLSASADALAAAIATNTPAA